MICNVAVSEQGTSQIKNMINDNPTPGTTEDATSGKTKICKKLKIINSDEKYTSVDMSNIDSTRIMTSYQIHVVSNV